MNREHQFDTYVELNKSKDIERKRQLRIALRALDGQIVRWHHEYREVSRFL